MLWKDWLANFTHLFLGLAFPSPRTPLYLNRPLTDRLPSDPQPWHQLVVASAWDGDAGGNRLMKTWPRNPKIHVQVRRKAQVS